MSERCEKCNGVKSGCKDTGDKFCDCNEPALVTIEVELVSPLERDDLGNIRAITPKTGKETWIAEELLSNPNDAARKLLDPPVPDALEELAYQFHRVMFENEDKCTFAEFCSEPKSLDYLLAMKLARFAQAHADKQTAAELRKILAACSCQSSCQQCKRLALRMAELKGESK